MSDQTGPQPGQGHPWGPQQQGSYAEQQGSYAEQQGRPAGAPGPQAPPWGAPGGPGAPGQPGSSAQPGPSGHQGAYGPQSGPGQPGPYGPGPGASGATPPHGAATSTTPVAGSSGMSTAQVVRLVLHVLALLLVVIGISVDLDDRDSVLWSDTWTWAGFATLMALAQVAALLPRSALAGAGWTIGAVGAGGLLLFWTLLMLPMISTNMAFLVTLGTACATAAVLLSPDRKL